MSLPAGQKPPTPSLMAQRMPPPPAIVDAELGSRPRRPGDELFEYAYLHYVRKASDVAADRDLFDDLAAQAEPEEWDGQAPGDRGTARILRNYVRYTFKRALQQGKVPVSTDGEWSAFNTGLATNQQEPLYGLFRKNHRPEHRRQWVFHKWVEQSKREFMEHFSPAKRPEFVTYTDSPADYIYDWSLELTLNYDHILNAETGNLDRFPPALQGNPYMARILLDGAVERAKDRVRRNFKAAVPSWYPTHGTVSLLLPLSLQIHDVVDLALVVGRQGESYRGHTVLTPRMAYSNARLLARPDSDWLKPASDVASEDDPAEGI
ncbi:DUF3825 domain-containing protein [Streptomyces sp. NPDC055722]